MTDVEGTAGPFLAKFVSSSSSMKPAAMPQSGWLGHAPFAFWLVEKLKPRSIVELGSHKGYSYFCFCQQVAALRLPTKCYAIDTWQGDEHTGFYGEKIYKAVNRINEKRYSKFSQLIRAKFSDAVARFDDKSIDLLHIDGRHWYEDVKEDFLTWVPKLSDRAVVLFHDTQVRERDFGVYKFWAEIAQDFPHFEFVHHHGLGVLAVGPDICPDIKPLFDIAGDPDKVAAVRNEYERLAVVLGRPTLRKRIKLKMRSLSRALRGKSTS